MNLINTKIHHLRSKSKRLDQGNEGIQNIPPKTKQSHPYPSPQPQPHQPPSPQLTSKQLLIQQSKYPFSIRPQITFRYFDPAIVPLFSQLRSLTEQLEKLKQKEMSHDKQGEEAIINMLKSAHKIQSKMHQIINQEPANKNDASVESPKESIVQTPTENAEKPAIFQSRIVNEASLNASKAKEQQCLQALTVINDAATRIQELEKENKELKAELQNEKIISQKQRQDNLKLLEENEKLKERLVRIEQLSREDIKK